MWDLFQVEMLVVFMTIPISIYNYFKNIGAFLYNVIINLNFMEILRF